jgi:ribonuclease P protein component
MDASQPPVIGNPGVAHPAGGPPRGRGHPPAARLHHGGQFSRVFNHQQKAAGRHLVVLVRSRHPKGPQRPRLGLMVPVKAIKLAVRRHQVKRWIRELFRLRLQDILGPHDLVVLLRADPPAENGHAVIDAELLSLLPRALAAKPQTGGGRGRGRR